MARPIKKGLDYFPLNTGFFDDDKIALVSEEFGILSELIAIKLLGQIYGNEGYYIVWNEDKAALFAKRVLSGEKKGSYVSEVVNGLVRRGLFDKGLFDRFGILTSKSIQNQYVLIKRTQSVIKPEYRLNTEKDIITEETGVITEETGVITEETGGFYVNNPLKKRKEKKSKIIPPYPPPVEQEPMTVLRGYAGDIIPVDKILLLWNDIWQGTKNVASGPFLNGIESERLQTLWVLRKDMTEYETVFRAARSEYDDGGKCFAMAGVLTEANFARLLLIGSSPPREKKYKDGGVHPDQHVAGDKERYAPDKI